MNATQIKALSWLTAAGLTGGLSYYVWDFVSKLPERQSLVSEQQVRDTLTPDDVPVAKTDELVPYEEVKQGFHTLNWTGSLPPPPPVKVDPIKQPTTPTTTPVSDIVRILMVQEDTSYPESSSIYIKYKPSAGVVNPKPTDEHLRTGERLLQPHQHIRVARISADEGVTFAFDAEGRKEEVLVPQAFDPNTVIVKVDSQGVRIPQRKNTIPKRQGQAPYRPRKTTPMGKDRFRVGSEDSQYISDHFSNILTQDVRHKRYIDPRTGAFAGIELKYVKPGSIAERHGAAAGDIIKSINGHPVTSVSEAVTFAKNNSEQYTVWQVVVENKGKTRTVVYETPSE